MSVPSAEHPTVDRGTSDATLACVDVIIAARDCAATIERAVMSALAQEEVRTVIVVDDGSTDDTAAKARRCDPTGEHVVVKRLPASLGPSAARNAAIELSMTPWLAILDGDDFFLPGRIGMLLSAADDWDFVADDLLQVPEESIDNFNGASTVIGQSFPYGALTLEAFVLGNVTHRRGARKELGFLKPIIRRSFLARHGLRYHDRLRLGEDYALYARALAAGAQFCVLPTAKYVSIARADSISGRHTRQDLERFRDFDCELMEMRGLRSGERRALAKHYVSVDCRVQWLAAIEAIKARQHWRFLCTLFRSGAVARFVSARLLEEIWRRSRNVIAARSSANGQEKMPASAKLRQRDRGCLP